MRSTASARSPPAAQAADKQLREQRGNVERAIHEVIENNVRIAGAQGFATNVGGMITMAVTIPANVTGLAMIQCRMVAGIAHLRGHDLADPRVRNAILALLLGEEQVHELVKKRKLPSTPMAIATAPVHDPTIDRRDLRGGRDRHRRAGSPASGWRPPSAGRCPWSAAWSAWAPTATRPGGSVATPTARCCRVGGSLASTRHREAGSVLVPAQSPVGVERAPAGGAVLEGRDHLAPGAVGRGRTRPVELLASLASSPCSRSSHRPQPRALHEQRADRVEGGRQQLVRRRGGPGRRRCRRRARAGRRASPTTSYPRALEHLDPALRTARVPRRGRSGGEAEPCRRHAARQRLVGQQSRAPAGGSRGAR